MVYKVPHLQCGVLEHGSSGGVTHAARLLRFCKPNVVMRRNGPQLRKC